MMKAIKQKQPALFARRTILFLGSLLLLYPFIRFINHRVPRKPKIVEVNGPLKIKGYLTKDDFILFSSKESLWAVSRSCTHLGCRLNYKEKDNLLECPCHQSRFSTRGELLNGPAKKPLTRYPVEEKGSPPTYYVTIQ